MARLKQTKLCSRCGCERPIEEFGLRKDKYGNSKPRTLCKKHYSEYMAEKNKKYRELNPDKYRSHGKKSHDKYKNKMKMLALNHYGGDPPKCACCGESHIEFLCLDHIDGGGGKHRRDNNISRMSVWVVQNNFPDGFRVLCVNCNHSLGIFGYCPHNKEEE
jgi:hypothetical protein